MREQTVRKTDQEPLRPTPAPERALEAGRGRCRPRDNAALEPRLTAWERGHGSGSRAPQEAALKAIRAERPEFAAIQSPVVPDGLARLDRTDPACLARVKRGEQAGFPRFQGRHRYRSFTFQASGNGARFDHGCLVLAKLGRLKVQGSRRIAGTPRTGTSAQEADGW